MGSVICISQYAGSGIGIWQEIIVSEHVSLGFASPMSFFKHVFLSGFHLEIDLICVMLKVRESLCIICLCHCKEPFRKAQR